MALSLQPGRAPNPGTATVKAPAAAKAVSGVPMNSQLASQMYSTPAAAQALSGVAPPKAPAAPKAAGPPPLDATALANIASYIEKENTAISGYQGQETTDTTAAKAATTALQQQNPIDDLKLMTGANANGGFYGSGYGQQLGQVNQGYATKEGAVTSGLSGQLSALASQIATAQGAIPLYENQQAAGSAGRAATAASKAPALIPSAPTAPTASKAVKAQGAANNKQLKQTGTPMGGLR